MTATLPAIGRWEAIPFRYAFSRLKRPVESGAGIVTAYTDGAVTLRSNRAKERYHEAKDLSTFQGVMPGDFVVHGLDIMRGSIGVSDSAGAMSPVCTVCLPNRGIDANFMAYAMRVQAAAGLPKAYARGVRDGGADFRRWETLAELPLPNPPAERQRQIADYLDRETATIDALIEKQSELIRLSKMRRVLMIDAVLEESWSSSPLTSIKSLTRTHGLVDGDWVESKDQDPEGRVRLTQLADVGDGFFRDRSDRWVNDETFDRLRCFALNAGDILIARMPDPIGRACVVPALPYRAITVVDVAILRPVEHADSRYLAYVLNGSRVRGTFESLQDGATRQRITRKNLDRTFVPLPSLEQQRAIADHLDRETAKIDALIAKAERFIELAQERRTALITAAVTGQLEIPTED